MTSLRTSAILGNIFWILMLIFGLLLGGDASVKSAIFFMVVAARNIQAVWSTTKYMDKPTTVMNIALTIFAITVVCTMENDAARIGGLVLAPLSALNVLTLASGKVDGWIARPVAERKPATAPKAEVAS